MAAGDLEAQRLISRKRQKREDEESSSSPKKQKGLSSAASASTLNLALDDLGDDELIQIFRRLPTAKFAVGLKLVSKRWCSLISHPYFVSQFITHHINKKHPNPTRVFISNCRRPRLFRVTGDHDSIFESRGYALEFLPEEREFVTVVASCNDLLYCRVIKRGEPQKFFVCNPLTKQWFLLPSPPPRTGGMIFFGLVCEPNYHRWKKGQQYECRFRAVQIVSRKEKDFVDTYCSETEQWNESLQFGQQYLPSSNIVAHDGKLHWFKFFAPGVVVVYDPFNNSFQSIIIDGFDLGPSLNCERRLNVGVCQGMVRFVQSVTYMDRGDNDNLSVWELEDYASGRVSLKHRIFCKRIFDEFAVKYGLWVGPLACDPNIQDVVYMGNCLFIIPCKIENGELKVINNPLDGSGSLADKDILNAVIPWWPTPLPKNSHDL